MNFSLGVNSGQEGLFWLRVIRKHHPDVPVVLLTAYADISLAVKGLKNGAADFITKPWDNDDLLRKLKDVLDSADEIATLDEMEKDHIRRTIDRCHGPNKGQRVTATSRRQLNCWASLVRHCTTR